MPWSMDNLSRATSSELKVFPEIGTVITPVFSGEENQGPGRLRKLLKVSQLANQRVGSMVSSMAAGLVGSYSCFSLKCKGSEF